MGADCCAGKKTLQPPKAGAVQDSCNNLSATDCSSKTDCCTPNNEKCNEECLKSVAATLCAEGVGCHTADYNDHGTGGCSDGNKASACDAHLQMAFAQYQSFLDNVRCICRSMIERGYKSCCKPSEAETEAQAPNAVLAVQNICNSGEKDCCGVPARRTTGGKTDCCSVDKGQRQCSTGVIGKSTSTKCCDGNQASKNRMDGEEDCCSSNMKPEGLCVKQGPGNCCDTSTKSNAGDSCGGGCCGSKKLPDNCCADEAKSEDLSIEQRLDDCDETKLVPKDSCKGDCCGNKRKPSCTSSGGLLENTRDECSDGKARSAPRQHPNTQKRCQTAKAKVGNSGNEIDVERGFDKAVRVGVTGMTCNGCSDNLTRNLAANGAHNIRVNYLQGHADFTLDPTLDLDEILVKTREATGFQITIMGGDESITVLTSGSQVSAALDQLDFDGVKEVIILNKSTVRIHYNPAIIGARELFYKIRHLSITLAPPQNDQQLASGRKRFLILLVETIASFAFTIPVLVLAWGETHVRDDTKAIISLILASLVQFLAVPVFYKPALKSLIRHGVLELDMLVVVAITAAYIYSVIAFGYLMSGRPLETASFFETSSLLISLIMLGRLVASYARIRAVASVSVRSLQASTAIIIENEVDREIDARLLQFGDIFKVTPHSRVPTDGTILLGVSEVDESMVTGESLPVIKRPGEPLIAGTTNGSGTLVVQLTRLPGKNTITDIAKLVEDASSSKPRVQEIADRVAGWFLPTVLTIALVVFVTWTIVGIKVRNQTGGESVATAITYAVAVLAVSCPCGIGLAVPLVLVVANGIAARGGVIVKSAECTERTRKVTDIVFDKTGTLTEPDLEVVAEELFENNAASVRSITMALIGGSEHPVSTAIAKYLGPNVQPSASVTDVQSIPGFGMEGSIADNEGPTVVRAGHIGWTRSSEALPEIQKMLDDGMTILMVTRDSIPIAAYGLRTRLRIDAIATVAKLREDGINVHLVSGDLNKAVQAVAAAVGIDRANVASQRKPKEKQDYVATLMAQGKVVMFCGDGTNDAVAVAQADIGVQLSDSITSEVTRSAADIVLLSGLSGIPFLIEVSHAAFARIAFNFVWSAIYNVFAILLSAGAFVRVRIAPAYAGAGELVSILPIIVASLTMLLLKMRAS
ncbi:E1-E2 ATPase-domain-containing protein [Xylaria flabelliformis]|nr:E1-E2 ATPase-domain-containing protein [Xylaria flabelliformis]